MRILLFSDLHLDHPFPELGRGYARQRADELRDCLDAIIALADEVDADVVLSAGDLYEHQTVTAETAAFLADRLGAAGRPVFLAPGDEDPYTGDSLYATTAWPRNVRVFDHDLLVPVEIGPGMWLWGAAHLQATGTVGFLDGFRVPGPGLHLALFHGTEVSTASDLGHANAPVAPFRAAQVPQAGLAHAFVGHALTPAEERWHTFPGSPVPLTAGDPRRPGAVVVDVADDGTVQRRRHPFAVSRLHEVTVDVTGAESVDDVLERVIDPIEDLAGAVQVTLRGLLAPMLEACIEELPSWSSDQLEILIRADMPERDLRPVVAAPAIEEVEPSSTVVDLGGLAFGELEQLYADLTATPAKLEPAVHHRLAWLEEQELRGRARTGRQWIRLGVALVAIAAGMALVVLGQGLLDRALPATAIAIAVAICWRTRAPRGESPELVAARQMARTDLLRAWRRNGEIAGARHAARHVLDRAGLPTEPAALADLLSAARAVGDHQAMPRDPERARQVA